MASSFSPRFALFRAARVSPRPRLVSFARHVPLAVVCAGLAASHPAPHEAAAQNRPEAPPAAAGLAVSSGELPLVREKVRVVLDDGHATATYEHAFQNETRTRLEGNYHLLVGEGATATGFSYWNGQERIVGEVFEKEAAQEIYEALTGLNRDPGLLEQSGEGAFSFHVFPIEPAETKRIEVSTARFLPKRDGKLEYRVRLVRSDADVELDVHDARGIGALESPSHELVVSALPDGGSHVRVTRPKTKDTELVLRYAPKEAAQVLHAAVHQGAETRFVSLSFGTPPAPAAQRRPAQDLTLVLDRSGSMSGEPMQAAIQAAISVVDQLRDDDAVNVIAFDDQVETLFDAPRVVKDVRAAVRAYLSMIDPRGGTEIGKALERALAAQRKDERPNAVFFLTDGQSNGPQAIAAAAKDTSDTTVFTVGLGAGVDKALLQRIATLKHGRFAFVADARAVTAELPKLLAQLQPPVLTDLQLHAEGGAVDLVYPTQLPDVFADDELRIAGRVGHGVTKLVLDAKEHGVPKRFEVAVNASGPRPWVARSWALARVDALLGLDVDTTDEKEKSSMHDEVIDLGLTYDLVTPYTSFLALPEKEITADVSGLVGSVRDRRKKLLAMNKDAAALSRNAMPPGDPILRVTAPENARHVTAYFPFGLVQELAWDHDSERWLTRFLVPNDVPDGVYLVKVVIEHADGRVEASQVPYTIDASEPGFEVDTKLEADGLHVRVLTDEPAAEVRIALAGVPGSALALAPDAARTSFTGVVPLAAKDTLRVVVADRARNETLRQLEVTP